MKASGKPERPPALAKPVSGPPILRIMLLVVDGAARLILLVVQIAPFGARQHAVGFVRALELADVPLLLAQARCLTASQLAGAHAVLNAIALMLLPCVHARIARASRRVSKRDGRCCE
jgi:hypothetical protein